MTDNRLRILADGLFDGGLAADVAPKDLRAAVNVLSAAGRPGSAAELASMAARVRQFSVEVNAAAPSSIVRTRVSATAFTSPALSNDIHRSNPMFATRITRKAMSIFAITLLAAGTAAAAAGGALPMFEEDATEVVVDNDDETIVVEDGTHKSDDDQPGADSDDETSDSIPEARVENHNGDVDHHGKCTAWTNGSAKSATSPAFAELQTAADEAAVSIDEYCATLLGTPGDDDSADDDSADDDESDDDASDDDASDDDESDENGNGNSGNGNSGNGNSGNGNSGDGNSGKGRGNSQG